MILYLICGFGMVTCTVSPLSRFTAHLLPVYCVTLNFSCFCSIFWWVFEIYYMFNVHKNQPSRQTGSRNLMGPKTLTTIWGTYMKLVTKQDVACYVVLRIPRWLVPCLPFPGLPHVYFLLTARLRIFHVCRNENFRNRYLSFYWKKWFYTFLPVETEISVTKVFITANMKNSKSRGKQEVDVR
jgi:hypothetical protein